MTKLVSCLMGVLSLSGAGGALRAEPAEETQPAASAAPEDPYLTGLRERCTKRWTKNFIPMAERQLPKDHPLNQAGLRVTLDVTAGRNGKVLAVDVAQASGAPDFDSSAVDVVKDSSPLPTPPEGALSDDGAAHLVWVFERDGGACGNVSVVQKESPIEVAVPRLYEQGREGEAIRRAFVAAESSADPAISTLAKAYLKKDLKDSAGRTAVLSARLGTGDKAAAEALVKAVKAGDLSAAASLAGAGVPLCPLVSERLGSPKTRDGALAALAHGLDAACVAQVVAIANDKAAPMATRVAALRALGASQDESARKAVVAAIDEPGATIKAAAIAAHARAVSGRAVLFRLTPFLRDPSVEVRAAASGGIVRAVGDAALDQLYLIWKETDPRPYEQTAAELGALSSPASADMLGKFLKKDNVRIRVAAAAALASRKDSHARQALQAATKDAAPEVRAFAAALLPAPERRDVLGAASNGVDAYRALLRAGERDAAGAWLAAAFPKLDGAAKAEAFGRWLGSSAPAKMAQKMAQSP